MKLKQKWFEIKDQVINALKFTFFTVTSIMGLLFSFAMVWHAVGLPLANWALWLLFGLALLCEWLYVKWLMN